jgi:hypothetical protein
MRKKKLIMKAGNHFKNSALMLAILLISLSGCSQPTVTIVNPYASVDWATVGQFKTALHVHTTNSDGAHTVAQMIEEHYSHGFGIVALTEHNYLTPSWDRTRYEPDRNPPRIPVTAKRKAEIEAGVGRDGRGMIGIDYTNEHSHVHHVNSFFADFTSEREHTLEYILGRVESMGGISRLNHPGRYTGARALIEQRNIEGAIALSKVPKTIQGYVDLFMNFPSCVGMEIINKLDFESAADRVLWDGILMQTMPQSRPVWGFADDDSHSSEAVGYAWNVFLMPTLDQKNFRTVMETGAFYAVSRVSRPDNINTTLPNGDFIPNGGRVSTDNRPGTDFMLLQTTPSIANITVNERRGTITISGADYDIIEWIADGTVIATGATLRLRAHRENVNSYVRAQLRSNTGIAFTQPFGINISR